MNIRKSTMTAAFIMLLGITLSAQNSQIRTVFKKGISSSGGYGAITNKFTYIRGEYANMSGLYGGWFINHRFLIGLGAAAVTSNFPVPLQYSTDPSRNKSYEYGQVGLMTEYVIGSGAPVHLVCQLFSGAGFTFQYERHNWHNGNGNYNSSVTDENWFVVAEPGIQLEVNLFKWMRLSPGVSYRMSFGSDGAGLTDKDIRNISYNATLKFGKF